jgi:ATP-dependent DNA helicase RecG
MPGFFDQSVEFLKGVGPQKAELLGQELGIFTFGDLLQHFPFRYEDRTKFYKIGQLQEQETMVQVIGTLTHYEMVGGPRKKRLVGYFSDETGQLELVWFQGAKWVQQKIRPGVSYIVFGKPARFGSTLSMAHPAVEVLTEKNQQGAHLQPVYPTTEKLK